LCLRSSRLRRRRESIARFFAVAISQAPGLSGMPVSGQRSSAVTSASWASSSASPTSRTIRARPAISRADSILQTASIARRASVSVTATDIRSPTLLLLDRGAHGGGVDGLLHFGGEVRHLEH